MRSVWSSSSNLDRAVLALGAQSGSRGPGGLRGWCAGGGGRGWSLGTVDGVATHTNNKTHTAGLYAYDRVVLNPDAISSTAPAGGQSNRRCCGSLASTRRRRLFLSCRSSTLFVKVNSTAVASNRQPAVDVEITPLLIAVAVRDLIAVAITFPTAFPINLVRAPPPPVTVSAVCSPAAVQSGRPAVHAVDKELDLRAAGDLDGVRDPKAAVLSGDTLSTRTPIVAFTVPKYIPAPP